jgi:STE24 endopeptidase
MSRLLLLSILVLWMCPRDNAQPLAWPVVLRLGIFFGVYIGLVLLMAAWSRRLARRVSDDLLGRVLDRYNKANEIARCFIPVWLAVGVFVLGWGHVIYDLLKFLDPAGSTLPGGSENYWRIPSLLLGTLPAFGAWMGLWWAQYPADRALKEQSVLYQANEGMPIHPPPAFATFFVEQVRLQLGLVLLPVFLIAVARDVLALAWKLLASETMPRDFGDAMIIPIAAVIFVAYPSIMRYVVPTQPLPPNWELRRRLDALCRRAGLKYRDILLWQTNSSMGNAMVSGLFPRVRYIFLSDLLLETMRDEEIEAVFAHEIGHIVHRHMWWYVAFSAILMLFAVGPLALVLNGIPGLDAASDAAVSARHQALQAQIVTVLGFGMFAVLFGFLSRRLERQADVYAARTMQRHKNESAVVISHTNPETQTSGLFVHGLATATAVASATTAAAAAAAAVGSATGMRSAAGATHVGEYGASVVGSALQRVARVNNIPIAAREWLHGSIGGRIRYLHELAADSKRTAQFDTYMRRLYWSLSSILVMLAVWCAMQNGWIPLPR